MANDYATSVVLDSYANLYIAGVITVDTAQGWDIGVIRMDSTGNIDWVYTYDQGNSFPNYNDGATSICMVNPARIAVGGGVTDTVNQQDFALFYLDTAGNHLWHAVYDHNGGKDLIAKSIFNGVYLTPVDAIEDSTGFWSVISQRYDTSGTWINNSIPI